MPMGSARIPITITESFAYVKTNSEAAWGTKYWITMTRPQRKTMKIGISLFMRSHGVEEAGDAVPVEEGQRADRRQDGGDDRDLGIVLRLQRPHQLRVL